MFDVAIIGAGVIGAMTARELSRYQLKVVILEKENDVAMGTTKANSAIIHAGFDAEPGTLKAKLNVAGSEVMEGICQELGVKYRRNGSLVVAYSEEDLPKVQELYDRGIANGVKELSIIGKDELKALEPSISDTAIGALYAKTGAIVCPYELNIAAVGNAMDNGVELKVNYKVTAIDAVDDGYIIHGSGEDIKARFVVNATGVYSDKIAEMVGDHSFTITPRKGEYMLLDHDCVDGITHTLFNVPNKMGKGILVSPTVDNNLILGPTAVNQEDREDKNTTPEGLEMVETNARRVIPTINTRGVITQFAGLRAVGNTGDYILTSPRKGFWNAGGVESPGLSSAPAIAKYLVEHMAGEGLELVPNEKFNPCRKALHKFSEMSIEEKNEVIKKNPLYGHIVCRCETISEGEIVDAIHMNPPARDVDAVKRRTRAGMGRCQGGFCGPMVTEILAREWNIPMEEVTKFGGESYLNYGKTREVKSHDEG